MSLKEVRSHSHSLAISLPPRPPGIEPLGKHLVVEHKHDFGTDLPHQHEWTIKEEGVSTKLYSYEDEREAVAVKEG